MSDAVVEERRSSSGEAAPRPDHRIAVARQRRERMRARLLDATLSVWALEEGSAEAAVIRHVAERAGVSRATFYKHFSSLSEAVAALGASFAEEMSDELAPAEQRIDSIVVRGAVNIQIFLWRAVQDPVWGRFVAKSAQIIDPQSHYMSRIRESLRIGREQGELSFENLDAALAASNGALMAGIGEITRGRVDCKSFIESLTYLMLMSLTGDPARTAAAVEEAGRFIRDDAASIYSWWCEPSA